MLAGYEAAGGVPLPASAVRIHELLLHLRWLAEAAEAEAAGTLEGHGPEQCANTLGALVRRLG